MLHSLRDQALSFGEDGEEYDLVRPNYPGDLIEDLVADRPQRALDIGVGTGLAARALYDRVPDVLGIEPDGRMAAVARSHGIQVEESTFENWNPGDRRYDLVLSAQAWHWLEPEAAVRKAVSVLNPGGSLAVFWNFPRPSARFLAVALPAYRRYAPNLVDRSLLLGNDDGRVADTVNRFRSTRRIREVRETAYSSSVTYSARSWTALLSSWSDHKALPERSRDSLMSALGEALAELGEDFTMEYQNVLIKARKSDNGRKGGVRP